MSFEVPDSIKAKHVFGELTLGDIWPSLKGNCSAVAVKETTPTSVNWRLFHDWTVEGERLSLRSPLHYEKPIIPFNTKVLARDGFLKLEWNRKNIELHFFRMEPLKVEIL